MFDTVIKTAQKQVKSFMKSDTGRKILTDPRAQRLLMKVVAIRVGVHKTVETKVQDLARAYDLPTRDDVASLRKKIRDLEKEIKTLKSSGGKA